MTVDISSLNLQPVDLALDWDNYKDAQEQPPPPAKGRYTVRVPDKIEFGATKNGDLSAQIDPIIVGPTDEGKVIRFTRISAKPFKRGQATVSQIGDFLRAIHGAAAPRPRTPQEVAEAVAATSGATFQVDLDWEAYDKGTGWTLKGMENFPPDEKGGFMPYVRSGQAQPGEDPVTLRANVKITRFIAAG